MRFMVCTKGKRSVVSNVSIPRFNSLVLLYSIIRFYLSARKRKVATFLDVGQRMRAIEMATAKRTCEKGRGGRAKSIVNADSSCLSCLHRGKGNSPGRARRFPRRFVCCRAFAKNHPQNRESENSATGCESMFIHLFILFSRHSDPFTSSCFTAFFQLDSYPCSCRFPKESIVISATV